MFATSMRFVLSVIVSPRRLVIAALLGAFFYAAFVATKARLFPEPRVRAKLVSTVSTRSGGHGVPAQGVTRSE